MLRLVLITANTVAVEAIAQMADELTCFKILLTADFREPRDVLKTLRSATPDVILIDVGSPDQSAEMLGVLQSAELGAPIIGFSERTSQREQAALQEQGIGHLLQEPFSGPQLEAVIYEALHQKCPVANPNIFAFMPAKAGGGSSTVALHTAVALAELHKKVLLIESDRRSGVLSIRLNISNRRGLAEALEKAGELTLLEWAQMTVDIAGLHLLPANPARPGPPAAWADYFQLLRFVENLYDFIVVDLAEVVNQATAEVVRSARNVLIVSGCDAPSLSLAGVRFQELKDCKIAPERASIILNRWDKREISLEDAAKAVGQPIFATLPNDWEKLHHAQELHGLAPETSKFGQGCRELAERLAGMEQIPERQESKFALFRKLTRLAS